MKRFLALSSLMILFIVWPFYAQAKTICVDLDGVCSCCPEATACYTSINTAILNAQSGDVILVCEGIYYENIEFFGKAITLRSSDPNDPEIVEATIIDGRNTGAVVKFEGEGPNTILSGLTLRNGRGIYCRFSSPQITHCKIIDNTGSEGAGICCKSSSPRITHCTISNNSSDNYGGGVYCLSDSSSPIIEYCTISDNDGGGIFCDTNSRPHINHCAIEGNKANSEGYSGGIYCRKASPVVTDSTVQGNSDYGIYCDGNASSSPTINYCSITGNEKDGIVLSGKSQPEISHCSINSNKANGFSCNSESPATLDTCTINWNENYGIYCDTAPLTINYCTIQENGSDGIYCKNSSSTISHCTITENKNKGIQYIDSSSPSILDSVISKHKGNGIYAESSSPKISRCSILENEMGGIFCNASTPEIVQCQIIANKSNTGGGIYFKNCISNGTSQPIIMNCTISENVVSDYGGGIYLNQSSLKIDNCIIQKNRAHIGGGISTSSGNDYQIDISRCSLIENLASHLGGGVYCDSYNIHVTNCLILKNICLFKGSGIYSSSPMIITHCTIVGNQEYHGDIYFNANGSQIKNCILWNNFGGCNPTVMYSDILGGFAGEGNINTDPLFLDSEKGNYYLDPNSPCIDKAHPKCLCEGDPNCTEMGDTNDVLPFDRDGIGRPQGCAVDMGAYEYVDTNSCMPRASFTAEHTSGFTPLEVEFDASSSGGSLYENPDDPNYPTFKWDFGDGNTGEGKYAAHTYTNYGSFDVSLTVITDGSSHTLTLSNFIKVISSTPTRHVGEGQDYESIQEAIDDAKDGEFLLVHDGNYSENINFKGKMIRIQSENGAEKTIIDGGGNGSVATFSNFEDAHSVLEGFTLQNGSAEDGGGINCYLSSPTITKCTIRKNSAVSVGGIHCYRCSPSITNCIIVENRGGSCGGIYCNTSSPLIINNTITRNVGGFSGGISCHSSNPNILNCILWDNLPNEIYYFQGGMITYSDIQGGYPGKGNINKNPLFVNSEIGNYYLNPDSPCINSGDIANNAPPVDKEGIQRDPNEGIDMGAYEYVDTSSCTPRASFTADEIAGHYPLTVLFDASSSGGSLYENPDNPNYPTFKWDFGDGNTATTQDTIIEHIYNDPNDFKDPNTDPYGSYNVSLTITTDCGSHTFTLDDLIKIKSIIPTKEVGKEADYPYRSIQEAINATRNGGLILVHDGIYYENLDFKGKRITVRSENGPFTTFIDGDRKGSVVNFNKGEDKYSVLEGFTIQNGSSSYGGGIHCWGSSSHIVDCRLKENIVTNSGGGIYCFASSAIIDRCIVSENICYEEGGGVFFDHSLSSSIYNSVITKNKARNNGGGIYFSNSLNPKVIHCTIADNKTGNNGGGIYCGRSTPVIIDSIIWNNLPQGIDCQSANASYSAIQDGCPGEGNIKSNPLFVAAETGNYYLRSESPCVNSGIYVTSFDKEGLLRPQEGAVDIGAYEFVGRSSSTPRASFEANPLKGTSSLTVNFNATSSGGWLHEHSILLWDFGDGNTIQGKYDDCIWPEHTYISHGFYDVSLTITTDCMSHTIILNDCIKLKAKDPTREVGEGYNYNSIQKAINDAENGEYILVHDGTYDENIDFIGKGITLSSENGPVSTIINGGSGLGVKFSNGEDVFSILEGFTVQNQSNQDRNKIECLFSSPIIRKCIIKGESSCCKETGYGKSIGIYCDCSSSPEIINCLIIGNHGNYGGGITCRKNSSPIITNCTISNNYADSSGGAIYISDNSNPVIRNSILWGNLCRSYHSSNEISLWDNSTLQITCSDIQNIPEAYTDPRLCNIDADPLFVNPCGCDYRLRFDSPCIDSNCCCNDATCCIGAHDDIDGKIRPLLIRTGCNGKGYDMGAYEYGISLMHICLKPYDPNVCISFGFDNEADNAECESQDSQVLIFMDPNDSNDPPISYCTYLKEFQHDLNVYQWLLKLDIEALTDPNSSLTWDPNRLIERDQWTWKLVQGAYPNGKVLVGNMRLVHNYQIKEDDGEYLSILFKEYIPPPPPCHEFDLNRGWNLVSIPIIIDDMSRSSLFPDAIAVYYYDAAQQIYIYVEEDEPMRPYLGYWVLVKDPVKQKICGDDPNDAVTGYATPDSLDGLRLEKGWSMIGSLYGYTALNLSQGYIKAVYEYKNDGIDNGYSEPTEFDPNTWEYLITGKGYWILPSEECYLNGNAIPELPVSKRLRMLFRPRFREAASSDNWSAKITAYGQKSQDCATKARVIIGISGTTLQIPSPPNPPCATIELNLINPPSDSTKYRKDIRSTGEDTLSWVLWVKEKEYSDPNFPFDPNFPLLQWEIPSGLDHVLELRKGISSTGDILVEDMRTTASYQIKEGDGELLTVVWVSPTSPPDYCYRDADEDTYGDANDSIQDTQSGVCPEGYVNDSTDCDDQDPDSYPGAPEICDGNDNDCDGSDDEGLSQGCSNACGETGTEICVNGKWVNCSAPPEPPEICDGEDNNCDGETDEEGAQGCITYYRDMDRDGYGDNGDTLCLCATEDSYTATLGGDCDDNDPSVYPRLISVVSAEGHPGQTDVTVSITIDDAAGFAGGNISLTYDPNILIAGEVIFSSLIQDFLTDSHIIEAEGEVYIGMANSTALESGGGTLAEIIFDVSEDAVIGTEVPLGLEAVIINDGDSEPYCSLGINGEFRILERGRKGDLNQDEEITAADAILTLKISVGLLIPTDYQKWTADVNDDGEINAADAILILKASVTKETIFHLSPDHGLPGATVKIIGWNFGETQGDSMLYFGETPAVPISWAGHEIVTTVPSDIQAGRVDVTLINAHGFSSNYRVFVVDSKNQRLRSLNIRYRDPEDPKTVRIPSGIMAAPCDQVTIPVETDDAADIAGIDIELHFDPEVLTPVKVEGTALTDGFLLMFKASGDGRLRISLANDTGIMEGSGALINVIFEVTPTARELDSIVITISYIKLYDEEANPMERTVCHDGQVFIEGEGVCQKGQTSGASSHSSGIGPFFYYPYNPYAGYYLYTGNFSPQGDWLAMLRRYQSGNGYHYSSWNGYNSPSWDGYSYPSWDGNNYPFGNNYNNPYGFWWQIRDTAPYWMLNTYEFYHLPDWNYQAFYPDLSWFFQW